MKNMVLMGSLVCDIGHSISISCIIGTVVVLVSVAVLALVVVSTLELPYKNWFFRHEKHGSYGFFSMSYWMKYRYWYQSQYWYQYWSYHAPFEFSAIKNMESYGISISHGIGISCGIDISCSIGFGIRATRQNLCLMAWKSCELWFFLALK